MENHYKINDINSTLILSPKNKERKDSGYESFEKSKEESDNYSELNSCDKLPGTKKFSCFNNL